MSNTHLLGHDIKNAQWIYGPSGDNGFVAILGGISNTNSAAVIAYGPDFAGANGAIYMSVPNAAKTAVLDVIDITGATDTPVVNFHYPLKTDTINEYTADAGVTIDGIKLKDREITVGSGYARLRSTAANALAIYNNAGTAQGILLADKVIVDSYLQGDEIQELSAGASVSFPDYLKTDVIAEHTADAGVTIDGVLHKDNWIQTANAVHGGTIINGAITGSKIATGAVSEPKLATQTCYHWIPVAYGTGALGIFENFPTRFMKNADPGDFSYISFMLPSNWESGCNAIPVSVSTTATNISGVTQIEWAGDGESAGGNNVTNLEWTQSGVTANAIKKVTSGAVTATGSFDKTDLFSVKVEFYDCGANTELLGFYIEYTGYV